MTQFTYKTDNGLYNVELLEDQAKIAFNYLAEVEAEVQTLSKRIDVLRAAAKSFHEVVQENLTDSALIDEKEEEEKQES
jgi:hypothetical protein